MFLSIIEQFFSQYKCKMRLALGYKLVSLRIVSGLLCLGALVSSCRLVDLLELLVGGTIVEVHLWEALVKSGED